MKKSLLTKDCPKCNAPVCMCDVTYDESMTKKEYPSISKILDEYFEFIWV